MTAALLSKLLPSEREELHRLEQTIAKNLQPFAIVGSALETIRDKELYREQCSSFEEYCQQRWNWSANYARKNITAAKTMKTWEEQPIENTAAGIGTIVPSSEPIPLPETESQVREFVGLPTEQQQKIWLAALAEQDTTAANIKSIREMVEKLPSNLQAEFFNRVNQEAVDRAKKREAIPKHTWESDKLILAGLYKKQIKILERNSEAPAELKSQAIFGLQLVCDD